MELSLRIATLAFSVFLIAAILMQIKGTGSGMFGSAYGTFRTRRGFERILFRATVVLVVLFIVTAILAARYKAKGSII